MVIPNAIEYTDNLLSESNALDIDYLNTVREALEKQSEKIAEGNGEKFTCPSCGCKFGRTGSFCKWCGQHIIRAKKN